MMMMYNTPKKVHCKEVLKLSKETEVYNCSLCDRELFEQEVGKFKR